MRDGGLWGFGVGAGPDTAVMPDGWRVEQGQQYTRCWEDHETMQSICETYIRWPDGSETVV
ncbi:hypothetical protein ADL29_10525 [Streptomyces chattanoogensis]|uniref:Uncharacterized protein n=1 Tax=Streptomyces chattanoogensis TaxID=66876 RepID=A0A0N0XX62_9ACTN|nr:hypothetical protein ADL29_10525 [Streptomyces chattanoogensis]